MRFLTRDSKITRNWFFPQKDKRGYVTSIPDLNLNTYVYLKTRQTKPETVKSSDTVILLIVKSGCKTAVRIETILCSCPPELNKWSVDIYCVAFINIYSRILYYRKQTFQMERMIHFRHRTDDSVVNTRMNSDDGFMTVRNRNRSHIFTCSRNNINNNIGLDNNN